MASYLYLDVDPGNRDEEWIGFTVSWTPEYSYFYYLRIEKRNYPQYEYVEYDGRLSGGTTYTTRWVSFFNLTHNSRYYFDAYVYWADPPDNPNWQLGSTSTSVSVLTYPTYSFGLNTTFSGGQLNIYWTQPLGGNSSTITNYVEVRNEESGNVVFYDANITGGAERAKSFFVGSDVPGGWYTVKIYSNNDATIADGETDSVWASLRFELKQLLKWSWNHASGSWNADFSSNSSSLTSSAYNAITGSNQPTTNFPWQIWNDLVAWILDILVKLGYSTASYSSYMSSSDRVLTAQRWNEMRGLWNTAASALGGSQNILPVAYPYQTRVTGEIFQDLVNFMNSYID